MKVIAKAGREDIAMVYIAETERGRIEFVESVQPPLPREEKWVLIVSSLYGCPVGCRFCDAGGNYCGKLSREDILFQIDYLVRKRFPDREIPVKKFKIQFARIGEPSFNESILDVLESLPEIYNAPGLIPSISTVMPIGREDFFERLMDIKKRKYARRFQLQFSIHTTDKKLRDWLIPVKKTDFEGLGEYGERFYDAGGRKITLNFATAEGMPINPDILLKYFTPETFLIKLTPLNPTYHAKENRLSSVKSEEWDEIVRTLQDAGYDVIQSIGELEENLIGSNCGQYVTAHKTAKEEIDGAYLYNLQKV